jgi:DNA polymerase-1
MCQHSAEGYWTLEQEAELVLLMCDILRHAIIVGQNWNYDAQYIWRWWHFLCPRVIDTMIQQHSCFSNLPKNLAFLSSMYLDDHLYWKDDRTNWTTGPKGEGEDKYWIYNCTDAVRTLAINEVLDVVVAKMGLQAVNDFQQQLAPVVLKTMNRGIRVDLEARQAFSEELQREMLLREDWMQQVLGHDLNIRSPKQMADFFYRQMGMKEIKHRVADGSFSVTCNDEALRIIMAREPILQPLIKRIMELRSLGVYPSSTGYRWPYPNQL